MNAIVRDIHLLKVLFKNKTEQNVPEYLQLIHHNFDDRDVDNLIEHFRDKDRREEFFKEYKEIEILYEIISPDAFKGPFIGDYTTLSTIYDVVRKACTNTVYVGTGHFRKRPESWYRSMWIHPLTKVFMRSVDSSGCF